jgi:tellurite resistance protein
MVKQADPTKLLSELCFLYLTCSQATDDDLADEELETIVRCVRVWAPGQSIRAVDAVLERTLVLYTQVTSRVDKLKTASRCAHALRDALPFERLTAIVHDLARIANADGKVVPQERRFVEATAQTFGVPGDALWGAPAREEI